MYRSLARWSFRRGWIVVGLWVVALIGTNAIAGALGPGFSTELETPASESGDGLEVLSDAFPEADGGFGGSLVFRNPTGVTSEEVVAPARAFIAEVDTIDGVDVIDPFASGGPSPFISPDGTIALARITLGDSVDPGTASAIGTQIQQLVPDIPDTQIEIGGEALSSFEPPESELIGLAFAIVILVVAFGSVLAMVLPIGVALAGVGTGGLGAVAILSHVVTIPETAPFIGIMIGLGVGIDYALFIITRYRELTREGLAAPDAMAEALHTAGRAVVFAGITVILSLLGMLLVGLQFVSGFGIAASTTVLVTLIASITLVPALVGLTHTRIERTRWRGLVAAGGAAVAMLGLGLGLRPLALVGALGALLTVTVGSAIPALRTEVTLRRPPDIRSTFSYRWSRLIQARPATFAIVGGGLLILLTLPVFGLRLGFADEGNAPPDTTTRRAYDLIAEGFGPGANGPMVIVAKASADNTAAAETAQQLAGAIADDEGVAEVTGPFGSPDGTAWLLQVEPTTSPQDEITEETVNRLRSDVVAPVVGSDEVQVFVTGAVPIRVDFSGYLAGRIVVFFAAVLAVSFLLLAMVFRSLLVPLKAVIMNVLSISAAYGVVVAIFQWGWLSSVFGVEPAPIEPFVPMMLFAIVFGLSMDYEVFLLSRIREEYTRSGDPHGSVADGLAATARVITAAAAIMVVVFGAFLLEDDRIIKLFGTGLAVAVLLDATVVRMVLVPATMELLGARNWWLPSWMERILPRIDVEGHDSERPGSNTNPRSEEVRVGAE
jgi:RND superfamily putative drug exporter